MTDQICIGAIAGAFGVAGEVRIKSFTAEPDDIATYGPVRSEDGAKSFTITLVNQIKNGFAASLSNVRTKEEADALRGMRLYVDRTCLPSLPDDEFYHTDLMGLEVCDTGGTALGRVKAVMNYGAGDLLEIEGPGLKEAVLLPFTKDVVPTVDLQVGRIITDPPLGLFPESDGT